MDLPPPRRLALLVGLVAAGASLTSLGNGFALDDIPILLKNPRVHELAPPWAYFGQTYWPPDQGPALYRPLAVLGFALQWAVGGGGPLLFHLASVAGYILSALAVFWLARLLLPDPVAALCGALFAVHPVHVEAVANVMGQSELAVGILLPVAVGWYIRARRSGPLSFRDASVLAFLYGGALCFKEHALVLPLLLLLAELLLVEDATPGRRRLERLIPTALVLASVAVAFWTVRTLVTGGLIGRDIHPAFRGGESSTRLFTALGVIPEWGRLLLFPVHLSADYNPVQIPIGLTFGLRPLIGLVLASAALLAAVRLRRRLPVVSFGIGWVAVTLLPASNLLIPTGILLAERTLFLPSVGAVLAIAGLLEPLATRLGEWSERRRRLALAGVALVLAAGGIRSALRQPVWRDNATLFRQTALDAPRSYKARAAQAVMLLEAGEETAGEREYLVALELYRDDPNLFADLGDWYLGKDRCEDALGMYRRVLELVPAHWASTSRTILCLTRTGRLEEARALATVAVARRDEGAAQKLAYVDSLIARRDRR